MNKTLIGVAALVAVAALALLFRYDYAENKRSRVDRWTQKYEIFCDRKDGFMSWEKCAEPTAEDIFRAQRQAIAAEAREAARAKQKEAADLKYKQECLARYEKVKRDYSEELKKNPQSRMLAFYEANIKSYEGLCK